MLQTYLAVMAGGAVGVAARMWLSEWAALRWGTFFPWGTVLVNVTGCLIIGLFAGWAGLPSGTGSSPLLRQVVMIGILGGFTTFSSFSLQTLQLFSSGHPLYALGNIFLSVTLCLLATWGGLHIALLIKS